MFIVHTKWIEIRNESKEAMLIMFKSEKILDTCNKKKTDCVTIFSYVIAH